MCGIVAAYGDRVDPATGRRMLRRLAHRGPDGAGEVRVGLAWLGHRRLSIVDVDGGDQPLTDGHGRVCMVGNGEIYNHAALRAGLEPRFRTRSDNEVVLHRFARDGVDGLAELRGMFAFAVATDRGEFVAARDPLGIKPLYWARRDGCTLFASELRAFDPAWRADVRVFPPGACWTPEHGLRRLWAVPTEPGPAVRRLLRGAGVGADAREGDRPAPGEEPPRAVLAALRDRLVTAVRRRLMADVPVGVFLSGGLDSSIVAAIAAREQRARGRRVPSFAVGLAGSSDLVAARAAAEHLGTDHHERVYTADELVEAAPAVVRAIESFDPMLVHSAVPNFLLAEFASRHVKVVLTGEGADELFAGYDYHRSYDHAGALQDELVRSVTGLHNLNLQRCDRVTMAHGLEARVPFLDVDMVEFALALPAAWKMPGAGRPEKHLLRRAFEGWLPDSLLLRRKEQFGDGSGASALLRPAAERRVSAIEFGRLRDAADPPLRTREEAAYWREFDTHLGGIDTRAAVGRFAVA